MAGFDALTLECFLAVNEAGGFTRAAEKINRTQSAVSQQISKLETKLGKKLFIRGGKFTLTSDGEIFLGYAQRIMRLQREAIDHFQEPDVQGEVSFGLPEDFASVFLSELLREYITLHPRILLNVDCDLTLNLFERFKKQEFDLVLVKMNKPEQFPNGLEIYSEHLEWIGDKKFFEEQDQHPVPLVISPKPCVYRTSAINALNKANIKWRIAFSSHSYAGKIAAVKAGIGVSVLPSAMVPDEIEMIPNDVMVPLLEDSHVSLLKQEPNNPAVNNIEKFLLNKLR